MKKFVSTKVLEEASTSYKLIIKEDLSQKDVCLPTELVDLRTAAKQRLKVLDACKDKKNQTSEGLFRYVENHCGKDTRKISPQISCGEKY